MAFSEFCAKSGGSNLNAGTRTGSSTEPGTAADLTYASGSWVAGTGVFTVASGNPTSDGVAVGDWASVYADGSTLTNFVGRVTARSATTITVSLTVKSGTAPVDGTNTRTLKIGGAWKGPNAAEAFPFGFVQSTMVNNATDPPRINFKGAAAYNITAAMTHGNAGPIQWEGYTTSYGDGGMATIDGGTSGASYVLLTIATGTHNHVKGLIFQNNGATGTAAGVVVSISRTIVSNCVVNSVRGRGFDVSGSQSILVECEAYATCTANNANDAGFFCSQQILLDRCISHDNVGNVVEGFRCAAGAVYQSCIADSNGRFGFNIVGATCAILKNCEAYNNASDGIGSSGASIVDIENCNLIKNGGYGINLGSTVCVGFIRNCGFGSGTQANTSGTTLAPTGVVISGSVTYGTDLTPWVDPANGDFRINLAVAKGTGRDSFMQTAASYAGTVGYADIGAAQHQETAAATIAGPVIGSPIIQGLGVMV